LLDPAGVVLSRRCFLVLLVGARAHLGDLVLAQLRRLVRRRAVGRPVDRDIVLGLGDGRHVAGLGKGVLLDVVDLLALIRLRELGVAAGHAVVAAPVLLRVGVVVVVVA